MRCGESRFKITNDRPDYSTDNKIATPNATISVVGTDFMMSKKCFQPGTVAVIEGSVDVRTPEGGITKATARQRVTIHPDGSLTTTDTSVLVSSVDTVVFGAVLPSGVTSFNLYFTNSGATALTVSSVSIAGGGGSPFRALASSLGPVEPHGPTEETTDEDEFSVRIEFSPPAVGPFSDTLTISGDFPPIQIALMGTGSLADCDANGIADAQEVCLGVSDCNRNGIHDACENNPITVYGDIFPSGIVDLDDILAMLQAFSNPVYVWDADIFPCAGNFVIDLDDILAVLAAFSGNPGCPDPCLAGP